MKRIYLKKSKIKKADALMLFGGTMQMALHLRISHEAVSKWRDPLSLAIEDRIVAACWRHGIDPTPLLEPEPEPEDKTA